MIGTWCILKKKWEEIYPQMIMGREELEVQTIYLKLRLSPWKLLSLAQSTKVW